MEIKKRTRWKKAVCAMILAVLLVLSAVVGVSAESTVRMSSSGSDVKKLQLMLNVLDSKRLAADGKFGSLTRSALVSFQSSNGLAADGIAGTNTWAKLNEKLSSEISSGYKATVTLTSGSLNLRDRLYTSSLVVGALYNGNAVTVLYSFGSFCAVYTGTNCGFVAAQYLRSGQQEATVEDKLSKVLSAANSMIGSPYSISLAGQKTSDGKIYTDCSYLTQYCFSAAGVTIPRNAADQAQYLVNRGLGISSSSLTAGDLIFYSSYSNGRYKNITHVALYVGNGYIIDASSSKGQVVYRKIWGSPILYCNASALL